MKLNINIWRILGVLAIIAFGFIFFKILIYILISLMLFLIGYPITYRLEKIRIKNKKIPDGIAALTTILLIVSIVFGLFYLILPPMISEIKFLSELNFYDVLQDILNQFPGFKKILLKFGTESDLKFNLTKHFNDFINTSNLSLIVNNLFGVLGTMLGGVLCVLFITFFLLKDEQIVKQSILTITPMGLEKETQDILKTSKKMLSKYFAALFIDMLIVGISTMILLSVFGIKNALLISFVAGILNVIPYVGSVITMIIAIFLGVSGCIHSGNYELIGPTINKIFFTLLSINLIDGFLIQPVLFSNSVKAHPLEIFIVTLMASIIGGIPAMIIALPVYTLIRIVAKEFLTHLKFFKKISERIDE